MYPSSNFLGGGQFGQQPPQQQQYGQQQPTPGFQQPQQQQGPGGFMPQPTGFMGSQLQPQATGFPGSSPFSQPAPQQPQPTQQQQPGSQFGSSLQLPGMMPTGFQQQQQSLQPQHTAFQSQPQQQQQSLQPQSTAFQQPPSLGVQPTGLSQPPPSGGSVAGGQAQTSSQIAQSFQSMSRPQTAGAAPQQGGARIPNQRLSFITATDQAKFEQLFKSAVGDAQSLDGETAKGLLLRSNLPGSDLSKIWWVFFFFMLYSDTMGGNGTGLA